MLADVLLQVLWKLLSISGHAHWQSSQPIPLTVPGTISAAQVAVTDNATLTVGLQTLEHPSRLHILLLEGNPTVPSMEEGALPMQCSPIGSIDTKGQSIVQFLFHSGTCRLPLCRCHPFFSCSFTLWLTQADL